MSTSRLVTLTGVGGVGKTRLALRIAADVARAFPDGVWLVELAPLQDQELLVSTVATAVGVADEAGGSTLARLSEYLSSKRLLLVLDNCEHLVDGCATLAGTLLRNSPGLRILATSRHALGVSGECVLTVPPLSLPDDRAPMSAGVAMRSEAVQLFVDRGTAVRPDFTLDDGNAAAIAGICRCLDGIPLAIELAAARLRSLEPASILTRLDDRFGLLTRGRRDALPQHRTLRAAIEWSYDLCSPGERVLWARMSVFAGACELEAIEQVCSRGVLARHEVVDVVAGLVDKSIIVPEDAESRLRYKMLETVRAFGDDLLRSSGEMPKVRALHWDYYRTLVHDAEAQWFGPRQAEWLARIRMEQPNLRTALEFSLTEADYALAGLRVAGALYFPWLITGGLRECRRWLLRALELNPEPTRSRAKALHGCAYAHTMLGDTDTALVMLRECRDIAERLDDPASLAYAILRMGCAKIYQERIFEASSLLNDALLRFRELGDPCGVYFALRHLAMAATAADDPRAGEYGRECLAVCEGCGAEMSRSWALWVVGLEQWRLGRLADAESVLKESLQVKVRTQDLAGEAYCLEVLGWVAARAGETKRAALLLGAAKMAWRKVGSRLVEFGYLRRFHDPVETQVRAALGGETYQSLLEEGALLGLESAISYALAQDACPGRPVTGRADESPLTQREQQVAELVAQGMSNKEIAATLVVARRTAEGHVEHILSKLGFTSRVQIATWVNQFEKESEVRTRRGGKWLHLPDAEPPA